MIKDGQVRSLRRWLDEGCTLREAARRCGMDEKTARRYRKSGTVSPPRGPRSWKRKMCQESFWGLPRGRRVDWRFRCRAIACAQFSSPKGEPRWTLLRTALSSAAVSGLLTRSVQRGERAIGQAESSSPPVCGKWSTGHCLGSRRDKSRPLRLHVLVFPSRYLIRAQLPRKKS